MFMYDRTGQLLRGQLLTPTELTLSSTFMCSFIKQSKYVIVALPLYGYLSSLQHAAIKISGLRIGVG